MSIVLGPSGCITHVITYIGYIGYIALFRAGICRFCIWVELPVQRRLCPIFVRNVWSPDIHECFRGLTGSQRTPVFRASQFSIIFPTLILYLFSNAYKSIASSFLIVLRCMEGRRTEMTK